MKHRSIVLHIPVSTLQAGYNADQLMECLPIIPQSIVYVLHSLPQSFLLCKVISSYLHSNDFSIFRLKMSLENICHVDGSEEITHILWKETGL